MSSGKPINSENLCLILMDMRELNAKFRVYSESLEHAMYLLTPAFMEQFLNATEVFDAPLNASFIGSKLCVSVDINEDSFEVYLDKTLVQNLPKFSMKNKIEAILTLADIAKNNKNLWR